MKVIDWRKLETALKGAENKNLITNPYEVSVFRTALEKYVFDTDDIDFIINHAFSIVRNIFVADKDMYDALVTSIESSLRESTIVWEEWEYTETAKKVADRIIGK